MAKLVDPATHFTFNVVNEKTNVCRELSQEGVCRGVERVEVRVRFFLEVGQCPIVPSDSYKGTGDNGLGVGRDFLVYNCIGHKGH